jgi:transposase-like protein
MVQEAYVQGVSTRRVDDLVQTLGLAGIWTISIACTTATRACTASSTGSRTRYRWAAVGIRIVHTA